MATKKTDDVQIAVKEMRMTQIDFCIKNADDSPLLFNAMSSKAKHEFLYPQAKKTSADKKSNTLKHDPLTEYRESVYRSRDEDSPTALVFPCSAFKKAMMTAALDTPGMKKTELGRWLYTLGVNCSIYGVPTMHMAIVKSSGMTRVPDLRTRACLPNWCAKIRVEYVSSVLTDKSVATLLATAGRICGIGDFRQEKGAGNFGRFNVVAPEDCEEIIRVGGREAQLAALEEPTFFDEEAEELYTWFLAEKERRGQK